MLNRLNGFAASSGLPPHKMAAPIRSVRRMLRMSKVNKLMHSFGNHTSRDVNFSLRTKNIICLYPLN